MLNQKIVIALLIIGMASATTAYGTFAFFSDTETSTDNIFTAGDLDLTLDGLNGVTATIVGTNFAPGDDTSGSIMLRNEGSIFTGDAQGHLVDLDICSSVADTDAPGNAADPDDGGVSIQTFAKWLTITTLSYGGVDLLQYVGDNDGDGRLDTLHDLHQAGRFGDFADPGAAGREFEIAVHFAEDGPNYLKRDVSTLQLTFFLSQQGEVDLNCGDVGGVDDFANRPFTQFYFTDFDGGADGAWSSSTTTLSPNGSHTFLGQFIGEDVTLSLASVPAHSMLRIEFDLHIIDTWDGNVPSGNGPDTWRFLVDGSQLVDTTFSHFDNVAQCYPQQCPADNAWRTRAVALDSLGYGIDTTYHITLDVPHTAASSSLVFRGGSNQAMHDESWGLDNVRVSFAA